MIIHLLERMMHKEIYLFQTWLDALLSYAMGGIFVILLFDYCTLTNSGKALVQKVKQEIRDCLSEINFRSFVKPGLLMFAVYLLGILTIIRANFSYKDDIQRSVEGYRGWFDWSRYVSEFSSFFVQPEIRLTDISPIPQLLAILILAFSSVLLVYIIGNRKITLTGLLASIPLGLFPYFLECLSFKFDSPYIALSVLACIFPFLFITRKKAFLFVSIISLLVMYMSYQAVSGIYPIIVVMFCFQYWNRKEKTNKEILSFLGITAFAFCVAALIFKFFLMRNNEQELTYVSSAMYPVTHIISGALINLKKYALTVNHDLGIIWKAGIALVLFFFIYRSAYLSAQRKISSFFASILIVCISLIMSYGAYLLLATPLYSPRALIGFGILLAIICVYIVSGFKKVAVVTVLALNWSFFIFAFSYGNALADQGRYVEFRRGLLLEDLNVLYPNQNKESIPFQLKNSIDFTPVVKNIAKHYPVIERLVPKRLDKDFCWEYSYFPDYMRMDNLYGHSSGENFLDFNTLNLPVVFDSYYHTIQSDGKHVIITFKH